MSEQDIITLTETPLALRELGASASYDYLWRRVTDGRIPARRIAGKWCIARADLPKIARTLTGK